MFLIMQVLWKSFYIKKSFRIHIFLKKPPTHYPLNHISRDIPCHICVLMAGSIYLHFLWRGGQAGWDFGCAAGFLESETTINPLKWEIRATDEVCMEKENVRLFSGTVRNTSLMLKYAWLPLWNICLPRNEIRSCPVFLPPQQTQAFQTEVRKNRIITVIRNFTFINKVVNTSVLEYLGLWKSLYYLMWIIGKKNIGHKTSNA